MLSELYKFRVKATDVTVLRGAEPWKVGLSRPSVSVHSMTVCSDHVVERSYGLVSHSNTYMNIKS